MKERSGDTPNNDRRERQQKGGRGARRSRGLIRKPFQQISFVLSCHPTLSCAVNVNPLVLLIR
jgi:hypothetical protein